MKKELISAALMALLAPMAAQAEPTQWVGNGHYYEYIAGPVVWDAAFAAANASSYLGMQGYLATITSADENTFAAIVAAAVAGGDPVWLGGSDAGADVNAWTWRNGPEAGQAFTFTNWNGGEPNNCCGGEDYLQINWLGLGLWNDHGGPGNFTQANGYLVEYGGVVPEPGAWALMIAGLAVVGRLARRQR
jgi:hypothetical protein